MRPIKLVKKADIIKYLEDPQKDVIERRLGMIRSEAHKLKDKIRERPSRADFILSNLRQITLELEATASVE